MWWGETIHWPDGTLTIKKTGNLVLRTAQGTDVPTRSMASTTSVPASCICGGSRTLHLQCSLQIKGRTRRKSCQMKIQHPLIQDSMLHGSFVTTSTLHNDCKMHTRKAYEFHGNSATVNHPRQNSNDCRHQYILHTIGYILSNHSVDSLMIYSPLPGNDGFTTQFFNDYISVNSVMERKTHTRKSSLNVAWH